ncbi:multiubiquitin domain-containing protein [Williamsia maris]|uniref:Multiubiquitin n=1 Tax=Williamsia maris TaxID=72806 RepID=A0ABT1HG75_9NOCA|nr:multiubiquitin domain-containing protein [Williamsia maris]MCP2175906.1 Multiubiquitin [Williamsia maris]
MESVTKKTTTLVVNARAREWDAREITFEELVGLAYPDPPLGSNVEYTVTFRRGNGNKPEGSLKPRQSVKVKDGMIFDVTPTDLS